MFTKSSCYMKGTMNSQRIVLVVLLILLVSPNANHSAKILGLFPFPARSHMISFTALMQELARRGHQVTTVSCFPVTPPIANHTDITLKVTDIFPEKDSLNVFTLADEGIFSWLKVFFFWYLGVTTCERVLQHPEIQKLIHEDNYDFDVVLFENFIAECLFGLIYKIKAPVINLSPHSALLAMGDPVGNPIIPSYIPDTTQSYTDHMTFSQRIGNTIAALIQTVLRRIYYLPQQDAMIRKYFNDSSFPGIAVVEKNASLYLLNNHVTMSYPQPFTPNTIEVGGMHIKPPGKLPKDLQKFMDEAEHGVVYFSLGSNARSTDMPKEMLEAFLGAFSKIKQKVLWKWEGDTLPGQPPNVLLGKWLPQRDILAHPNLRLFITHSGLLSTQESVYRGVPLLAVPVFGDQKTIADWVSRSGYGVKLDIKTVTTESLSSALHEVMSNPRYRQNVQQLSALFKDRPAPPLETAVYWTEYVLRHNGARHLRSAALDLTWYQYYLLDVLALLLGVTLLILAVLGLTCRAVYRLLCSAKKSSSVSKKKKRN